MKKYISLLRGINVSGQKKIKMVDLKSIYESLGFANVKTYIQSGNVVFESSISDVKKLKRKTEQKVEKIFGFPVSVIIRSNKEFKRIIHCNPFIGNDKTEDDSKFHITFLTKVPAESAAETVRQSAEKPEALEIRGKEVYLYCPNGYGRTKLSNSFLERKLGVTATTRNWKTVKKLYNLTQ